MALAIAIFVIGIVSAVLPSTPAPAPTSIRTVDRSITRIERDGEQLWIFSTLPEAVTGDQGYLISAADVSARIGKGVKAELAGAPKNLSGINIKFRVPGADRLGNPGTANFMTIEYPASDLRAANYKGLEPLGVLNLASSVSIYPSKDVRDFCKGGGLDDFCAKALR